MKESKRQAAKTVYEEERQRRVAERNRRAVNAAKQEVAFHEAIQKKEKKEDELALNYGCQPRVARLIHERDLTAAFTDMLKFPIIRHPREWEPQGKGRLSIFRSLANHLFAKYKTPPFLWNIFLADSTHYAIRGSNIKTAVVSTAGGRSLYDRVKDGTVEVPLTRAMCHDFLTNTAAEIPVVEALRRAQMRSCGSEQLIHQWMAHDAGRHLHTKGTEDFWFSVMGWFIRTANMLNPDQISPMLDYIQHKFNEDTKFSMKGRTPISVIRDMEEWHNALQKIRKAKGENFLPCGLRSFDVTDTDDSVWRIDELLSDKVLLQEGRDMRHCVYSYSHYIKNGRTSIWSMTHEYKDVFNGFSKEKCLTIEVQNISKTIVQARGFANRLATNKERVMMNRWAGYNNLTIRC